MNPVKQQQQVGDLMTKKIFKKFNKDNQKNSISMKQDYS